MTTALPTGYRFVSSPPLELVSRLMRNTWAKPSWVYDVDLLRYHLAKPSGDPELSIGVENETSGDLVAYNALIPTEIEIRGRRSRSLFGSFLTAGREVQATPVARMLQRHALEVALRKQYELYVAICETGGVSGLSIGSVAGKLGLKTRTVRRFRYVAALGDVLRKRLPEVPTEATRTFQPADATVVERLLANGRRLPIHRLIARSDYEHRYRAPQARSFVFEIGSEIRGFAHALILEVATETKCDRNAYLQDLELGSLDDGQAHQFLGDVLRLLVNENCNLLLAPEIGYFPLDLLRQYSFRGAPRSLDLLLTPLAGLPPGDLDATDFCLDVY